MTHYLNTERMRVVDRNDRGNITYRKSYKFGDEVDTSKMDEERVNALVESGTLVESTDDLQPRGGAAAPVPGSGITGAATSVAADHAELAEGEERDDDETDPSTATSPTDGEVVDRYSSMDYGQLQDAARQADIKSNQSADALRQALREHDAS